MSSLPKASEKLEPSLNEKKLSEKKPMQVINLESSDADFDVTPSSSPFPGTHSSKDIVEEKEKDEIDRKLMPPPKIPPVNRVKEGTPKSVRSSPDRIQGAVRLRFFSSHFGFRFKDVSVSVLPHHDAPGALQPVLARDLSQPR